MRRFPHSWITLRTQLGFRRIKKRQRKSDQRHRKSRFEPLEIRAMLSGDPLDPYSEETVTVGGETTETVVSVTARPEFVLIETQEAPRHNGPEDDPDYVHQPLYLVATEQTPMGPKGILSLNPNYQGKVPEGLQQLRLELQLQGQTLDVYDVLIDVAEESFRTEFLADRVARAEAEVATLEPETAADWLGEKVADSPFLFRRLDADSGESTAERTAPEPTLDLVSSLAKRQAQAGDVLVDAEERIRIYNDAVTLAAKLSSDRLAADTDVKRETVEEDEQLLRHTTLLLATEISADLKSEDLNVAAAALAARDALVANSDLVTTLFTGLGVDREVERKTTSRGDTKAVSFVESGHYEFSDRLEINLGAQQAMIQVTRQNPLRFAGLYSAAESPAVEDGSIDEANPSTNGGAGTSLHVDGTTSAIQEALIRFNLAEVSAFDDPTPITEAKLKLTEIGTGAGSADVYVWNGLLAGPSGSVTDWDESNSTWNHVDGTLDLDGNSSEFTLLDTWDAGTTFDLDATDQVRRALLYGDANGDGVFDATGMAGDIEAFHLAVYDWDAYVAEYGPRANATADLLARTDGGFGDGTIDTGDIVDFLRRHGVSQGDFNLDGTVHDNEDYTVDGLDWAIWQNNYGLTNARFGQGDANFDGVIDEDDFDIWEAKKSEDSLSPVTPEVMFWIRPTDTSTDVEFAAQEHTTLAGPTLDVTEQPDLALNAFTVSGTSLRVEYSVLGTSFTGVQVKLYDAANPGTPLYTSSTQSGAIGSHAVTIAASVLSSVPEGNSIYAVVTGTPSSGTQANTDNDRLDFEFSTDSEQVVNSLDDGGMDYLIAGRHTLRELLEADRALDWYDTITFDASLFESGPRVIELGDLDNNAVYEQLLVAKDITIEGPGAPYLTISGGGNTRVMQVSSGVDATLKGLTIAGGYTTSDGGGIYNQGTLTLDHVHVVDNHTASTRSGGGVYSANNNLTVQYSSIEDNSSKFGGGIWITTSTSGVATIDSSLIARNSASGRGGGLLIYGYGQNGNFTSLVNTTVSDNFSFAGGGLWIEGYITMDIVNATIFENRASNNAYNLGNNYNYADITMHNSIAAGGYGGPGYAQDVHGVLNLDSSNNLFGKLYLNDDLKAIVNGNEWDLIAADLMLAPLDSYGGPTDTHAVLPESNLVLDNANMMYAMSLDQRGMPNEGSGDIGAYEFHEACVVNTTADIVMSGGWMSLRQALNDARARDGEQTITFDPSVFGTDQIITLTYDAPDDGDTIPDPLTIDSNVTIVGPGTELLTISGGRDTRVLHVLTGMEVTIQGLSIREGKTVDEWGIDGAGGGILNEGELVLQNVELANNEAYSGGGIFSSGVLTLVSVDVVDNVATSSGGGLYATGNTLISASTIAGNETPSYGYGGGILVDEVNQTSFSIDSSTVEGNVAGSGGGIQVFVDTMNVYVTNSTFSRNSASWSGGGMDLWHDGLDDLGEVVLTNVTVVDNWLSDDIPGGGIAAAWGAVDKVKLINTIVARNTVNGTQTPDDVYGYFDSTSANNLIGWVDGAIGLDDELNLVGGTAYEGLLDPKLAPLGNYGGPTQTHALLPGSPTIDAGDDTNAPAWDQRGQDYHRVLNNLIDIGAFEAQVIVDAITGDVAIYGSDNADGISLRSDGVLIDSAGGHLIEVDLQNATSITVDALAGDDLVSVHASLTSDVEIHGGSGEDVLEGGVGADVLIGGMGADTLYGGAGDDELYGAFSDSVELDDGGDTLFGDSGEDTFYVDYTSYTYDPTTSSYRYTPVGGDYFQIDSSEGDTVSPQDMGSEAPAPAASTWNQGLLWEDNYGFGEGWNLPSIDRLEFTDSAGSPTALTWVRSDGHTVVFENTSGSLWEAVSGDPMASVIDVLGSNIFEMTDKYGMVMEYTVAAAGMALVTTRTNRNGVSTTYAYADKDGNGDANEIVTITVDRPAYFGETNHASEVTTYSYSDQNGALSEERVTSISDLQGRVVTLVYHTNVDDAGKLQRIELPEVQADWDSSLNRFYIGTTTMTVPTTTFGYDGDYLDSIFDSDLVHRTFTWTEDDSTWNNRELWVIDQDANPIRYLGASSDVYSQWVGKTGPWQGALPQFRLADDLEGMGVNDTRHGYMIDEHGRTINFEVNRDGAEIWRQGSTGRVIESQVNNAGLPTDVEVQAPGDSRVVDQTVYTYDSQFNVSSATYFDGSSESWSYDPNFSQITEHVDELGRVTRYEIDSSNGNVTEMRLVVGSDDTESSGTDDVVTQYEYEADGLPRRSIEFRNDVDGTAQNSFVTEYTYTTVSGASGSSHIGRWLESTTYGGDDPSNGSISLINGSSISVISRDSYGNATVVRDEEGRDTSFTYDSADRLTLIAYADPGGGQEAVGIAYQYSAGGRLSREWYGPADKFTYALANPTTDGLYPDQDDLIVNEYYYDACDCVTGVSYDCWGVVVTEYFYQYNPDGTLSYQGQEQTIQTDWTAGAEGYEYGAGGQLLRTTQASSIDVLSQQVLGLDGVLPITLLTGYDSRGYQLNTRNPSGELYRVERDARGRATAQVAALGANTSITYDAAGQMIASTDGVGRKSAYSYDDAGRLRAMTAPGKLTTTYQYDSAGQLRMVTDPLGRKVEYVYDERGRITQELDENQQAVVYTYHDDNQLHTLTDPEGNETTWLYDDAGRVKTETNELNDTRSYEYDQHGRLSEKTDREGRITRYTYDTFHRLANETWWVDDGQGLYEVYAINYEFDAAGNLLSADDSAFNFDYDFRFDDLGRQQRASYDLNALQFRVQFDKDYDDSGRMTSAAVNLGGTYSPAAQGNSDSMSGGTADYLNTYAYDAVGRLTSLAQTSQNVGGAHAVADKRVDFTYNEVGQFATISRYAGLDPSTDPAVAHTALDYDPTGRLIQLAHYQGADTAGTLLAGYGYSYDASHRLLGIDFLPTAYDDEDVTYTYDERGQLIAANYDGAGLNDESYQYDDNGNREGEQDTGLGTSTYAAAGTNNQLLDDGTYTYTYDKEGNRLTRTLNSGTSDEYLTEYEWDHRNRLTKVTFKNNAGQVTKVVEHEYDGFNQWIGSTVDTDGDLGTDPIEITVYIHDEGQIVIQFENEGTSTLEEDDLTHRYLWGPAVDQLMADEQVDWSNQEADGEVLWALTDHLGSVRDLVDNSGTVQNHKSYDAFGNVTAETNAAVDTVFGFTGKLFDDATGLQNNLHRWYDAAVGAWASEDPIGFDGGDANLSRYVSNEVTSAIDPTGELAWFPIIIIVGIGGVAGGNAANAPAPGDETISSDDSALAFNLLCGVLFAQTYFPSHLYHYTSISGYNGIVGSGTIYAGGGLYGTGVYVSSYNSAVLARLMGAASAQRVICIPAKGMTRIPLPIPGAWKIPGNIPIRHIVK